MQNHADFVTESKLASTLAGVAIFSALTTFALRFIMGNIEPSGFGDAMRALCDESTADGPPLYKHAYTGIKFLDDMVCGPTAYFHFAGPPDPVPSFHYFIWTDAALILLPMIEAKRTGAPFPARWPLVWWQVYQLVTMGVGKQVFWVLFIVAQYFGSSSSQTKSVISGLDAEIVAVSFVLGSVLPTVAFVCFPSISTNAFWQPFPTWIGIVQVAYGGLRRAVFGRESVYGKGLLRAVGAIALLPSIYAHWTYLFPILSSEGKLSPMKAAAEDLLKWDLVFAFVGDLLGAFWQRESSWQAVAPILASVVIGPGAALAGVCIWHTL